MTRPDGEDRGLARERTQLAWNRSGLAVVACVAVLLRHVWPLPGSDEVVPLAAISAGAGAWGLALFVGHTVAQRREQSAVPMSGRLALVLTAGTVALAVAGLILSLAAPV